MDAKFSISGTILQEIHNQLAYIYYNLPTKEDIEYYDAFTIPGRTKEEMIIVWSNTGEWKLETWGVYIERKIMSLKLILMDTALLTIMSIDSEIGKQHRRAVGIILDRMKRVIRGNTGIYDMTKSTQLWRPKTLIQAENDIKFLSGILLNDAPLPEYVGTQLRLLKLQLDELVVMVTARANETYDNSGEVLPPDIMESTFNFGIASNRVLEWQYNFERKAKFVDEKVKSSLSITALKLRINELEGSEAGGDGGGDGGGGDGGVSFTFTRDKNEPPSSTGVGASSSVCTTRCPQLSDEVQKLNSDAHAAALTV